MIDLIFIYHIFLLGMTSINIDSKKKKKGPSLLYIGDMVPTIFMQMFENIGKHLQEIWGLWVPTISMQNFENMGKHL